MKIYTAEFLGTFWLVLGGCGSAVLAAAFPNVGIGLHGVSLAFGLTVVTMAYTIGPISGCHLNPAVSVGLWAYTRTLLTSAAADAALVDGFAGTTHPSDFPCPCISGVPPQRSLNGPPGDHPDGRTRDLPVLAHEGSVHALVL